ncbi:MULTISPECIES: sensor domain-containing diguanylate cyclase [Catenuloplanes]|uniref:Diguanylate cyclase (GGDEF)-like protein/PAS domain S-box-containing protein n=1 Tax=Catenuloplanes niger TaxID=587534 RepID=A0AAE4CUQ5_9ACTN|nr:sensor domain-containing diguanylate cyclase [Catenuloplanes niger]MDR7326636.1 diguanylate cyclase (GGDEF)-like protein/PAS domain S-box-containing protein [Catenuloplanes niger]
MGTGQRSVRRAALGDPLLVGLIVFSVLGTLWYAVPLADLDGALRLFWPAQVVLDLTICLTSWQIWRMAGAEPATRRFWRSMAHATALFVVGDSYQAFLAAGATTPAEAITGGAVQLAFLAAGVCLPLWTMITHPIGAVTRGERLRFWLDAIIILAAVGAFIWVYSVSAANDGGLPRLVLTVAGAAGMLICALGVLKLALGGNPPFTRSAAAVGIVGVTMTGAGIAVGGALTDAGHYQLAMAASFVPCVLMAFAPKVQELGMRYGGAAAGAVRREGRVSLLPYVAVAATYALLVSVLWSAELSPRAWGIVAGAILISTLVVARQLAALAENHALLQRIAQQEARFRALVQHACDITVVADATAVITYASPAVQRVLGISPEALTGLPLNALLHPDDLGTLALPTGRDEVQTTQLRVRHADGTWRWLEVTRTNRLHDENVRGYICNARDVTDARAFQDQLRFDATHDALTGLANRLLFHRKLRGPAQPGDPDGLVGVLAIDLDGFKAINDTLGHHVGDEVLALVAERLRRCVRPYDTVARLGGDEFAVILSPTTEAFADATADRIRAAVTQPAVIDGHHLQIRASVGVAIGTRTSTDGLLRTADAAMYDAKRRGKSALAAS